MNLGGEFHWKRCNCLICTIQLLCWYIPLLMLSSSFVTAWHSTKLHFLDLKKLCYFSKYYVKLSIPTKTVHLCPRISAVQRAMHVGLSKERKPRDSMPHPIEICSFYEWCTHRRYSPTSSDGDSIQTEAFIGHGIHLQIRLLFFGYLLLWRTRKWWQEFQARESFAQYRSQRGAHFVWFTLLHEPFSVTPIPSCIPDLFQLLLPNCLIL